MSVQRIDLSDHTLILAIGAEPGTMPNKMPESVSKFAAIAAAGKLAEFASGPVTVSVSETSLETEPKKGDLN